MSEKDSLSFRREQILTTLKEYLKPQLAEEHQNEIAALVDILQDLDKPGCQDLIGSAEIAAKALALDPPNIKLASKIREDIELRIRRFRNPISSVLRGNSPPSLVILGLGSLLYIGIPLVWIFGKKFLYQQELFGIDTSMLALVSLFGALGSIVSIMVRIQDFTNQKSIDSSVIFFTGFFKPVIGTSFALFAFAVISSGLLPLTVDAQKSQFFFAALSFIAGFSERFAQDIVTKAEKAMSGR